MICAERQKIKIRHGVGAICGPRSGFGLFPHPLSAHTVAAIVGVIYVVGLWFRGGAGNFSGTPGVELEEKGRAKKPDTALTMASALYASNP